MRIKLVFSFVVFFLLVTCVWSQGLADKAWPKMQGASLLNNGRTPYAGPDTPDEKWRFFTGTAPVTCLNIGPDGTIYVGTYAKFFALNPDGTEKWPAVDVENSYDMAISSDGFVYLTTNRDKIYKIDAVLGQKVWTKSYSGYSVRGVYHPTIAGDGTVIFGVGSTATSYVFALNPDGTDKWPAGVRPSSGDNFETLPVIDEENGFVYMVDHNDYFYKIDLETGHHTKTEVSGSGYYNNHLAIDENGQLYFADFTRIYACDLDMNVLWTQGLDSNCVTAPSIGYDGTLFTGARGKKQVIALYPGDGSTKWTFDLESNFNWPAVVDINNTIYVVTQNYLYAVTDAGNEGVLKWTYDLQGGGYRGPAIGSDGTLYIFSTDGYVRALGKTVLTATVDLKPERLNKKSKGRWCTAYIELPEGYDADDIDVSTVAVTKIDDTELAQPLFAKLRPTNIGDYDQDGIPDLMVKFKRRRLIPLVKVGIRTVTITGLLTNGTEFSGSDRIKVFCKKK